MKYKSRWYCIINIVIISLSFLLLANIVLKNKNLLVNFSKINNKLIFFAVGITIFIIIHIFKLVRFYLILLEEKLEFRRFIRIYIKTTFINIMLPLKTGEVFRFYCYSNETNNYKIGFLSIVVERFFDTCALLIFTLPLEAILNKRLTRLNVLLLVFIIVGFIIYNIFYPIYKCINRFFILNIKSSKSIGVLNVLEQLNEWYLYSKKLIQGRFSIIFLLSFLAWTLEYIFVDFISKGLGINFSLQLFNAYINSAFIGGSNEILMIYTILGAVVMGLVMLVVYSVGLKKKGES